MKKILFLLSASFIITTIPSCDKSNPVNNGNATVLVPLKAGNSWVNVSWRYDSTGAVTSTSIDSLWVSRDTVIDGEDYFVISDGIENSNGTIYPDITNYIARNTISGYEETFNDLKLANYDYPFSVRDSSVISQNESVTVPAGTYNCIVYKYAAGFFLVGTKYQPFYGNTYICPNIGIIKQESTIPGSKYPNYRSVLTRVILN